jgi:hypothetical protein
VSRRKSQGPSVSFFAFQDIITSVVGIFVLITLIMMVDLVSRTNSSRQIRKSYEDTFSSVISDLREQLSQLEARSSRLDKISMQVENVQAFNKEEIAKELQSSIQLLNEQIERAERRNQEIQKVIDSQVKVKTNLQIEIQKRSPDKEELDRLLKQLEKLDSKIEELQTEEPLVFKNQSLQGRTIVIVEIHSDKLVLLDLAKSQREEITSGDIVDRFRDKIKRGKTSNFHYFLLVRPYSAETFEGVREVLETASASYGYDLMNESRSVKLRSEIGK